MASTDDLRKLALAATTGDMTEFERRIYEVHGTPPLPRNVSVLGSRLLALLAVIDAAKVIDKVGSLASPREINALRAALAALERGNE